MKRPKPVDVAKLMTDAAKRNKTGKPVFADVADFAEDERIEMIGKAAYTPKDGGYPKVAFVVDCGGEYAGKGDRYVSKLLAKYPELQVMSRGNGPANGMETIIVQKKQPH